MNLHYKILRNSQCSVKFDFSNPLPSYQINFQPAGVAVATNQFSMSSICLRFDMFRQVWSSGDGEEEEKAEVALNIEYRTRNVE